VVSGADGSEITDTLPPFEILARSGIFNVYSVAPERVVLPLTPGPVMGATSLDFVPHFSFREYDALIGSPPDLIVVPGLTGYTPEQDAAVVDWIRNHAGPGTTVLGICDGTMVVADTGLLDGHSYTTNPGDFDYVQAQAPSATLLQNLRYVDDGAIVTSSAVSSGIDATLHVVDRGAGHATALDVARQLGFAQTGVLDDPRFEPPTGNLRLAMGLLTGFEVRQQLGVLLYDRFIHFADDLDGCASFYSIDYISRNQTVAGDIVSPAPMREDSDARSGRGKVRAKHRGDHARAHDQNSHRVTLRPRDRTT
jgi:putative intracellular protease/amidase